MNKNLTRRLQSFFSGAIQLVHAVLFRQLNLPNNVHIIEKLLLNKKNKTSFDANAVSSMNHFFRHTKKMF